MGGFYRLSRTHAFRHALVTGEVTKRRDAREPGADEQSADGLALAGAVLEEEAPAGREACRGALDDRGERFEAFGTRDQRHAGFARKRAEGIVAFRDVGR